MASRPDLVSTHCTTGLGKQDEQYAGKHIILDSLEDPPKCLEVLQKLKQINKGSHIFCSTVYM